MRITVKFKCVLLLMVTTLLFSCKGKQIPEASADRETYHRCQADVYIHKDSVETHMVALFSVVNRRTGVTAYGTNGIFTVTSRKAELQEYEVSIPARVGDTLSYYLIVGGDRTFKYVSSFRLDNNESYTFTGTSDGVPFTKRMDIKVSRK